MSGGRIEYRCPGCGAAGRLELPVRTGQTAACRSCGVEMTLAAAAGTSAPLVVCPICGDDKLYVQKDFSQKTGCLIVAIGAALVPWTYGLSLAACALLDLILYQRLPPLTVCYVCGSRHAGTPISPDHHPFDLMTAQTYEARSLSWRRRRTALPSRDAPGPTGSSDR